MHYRYTNASDKYSLDFEELASNFIYSTEKFPKKFITTFAMVEGVLSVNSKYTSPEYYRFNQASCDNFNRFPLSFLSESFLSICTAKSPYMYSIRMQVRAK